MNQVRDADSPTDRAIRALEVLDVSAIDSCAQEIGGAPSRMTRHAFEECALPMWIYEHETLAILAVNEAALRTYGYSREEFLALTHADLRWAGDIDEIRRSLGRQGLLPYYKGIVRHRTRSGEALEVEGVGQDIVFCGAPARIISVVDVTARNRAARELRRINERLELVLEATGVTVCSQDTDLRYTWTYNPGFDMQAIDVVGKTDADLLECAEDAARIASLKRQVLETGVLRRDEVRIHRQGRRHTFDVTVQPHRNEHGDVVGVLTGCMDVTDRRGIESALRESRLRLEWILEAAGIGLWLNPLPLHRLGWDARTRELFFVDPDVDVTRELLLSRVHPEDRRAVEDAIDAAVTTGGTLSVRHRVVEPSTGDIRWLISRGRATFGPDGAAMALDGISFDVTEQTLLEQALRDSEQRLRQQVRERTAQVRALARELTLAEERERQAIASELHDDLIQALAYARMAVDGLAKEKIQLRGSLTAIAETLDGAEATARTLVGQLFPPVLGELGLIPALEWLADDFRRKAGLRVEIVQDGAGVSLDHASRAIVYRAVRELLVNVIKHARTDRSRVSVRVRGGALTLTVSDDGIGFDLGRIQEARAPGFGLFSVRERVQLLGGRVSVDSAPGAGTAVTLRLELPIAQEAVQWRSGS